MSLRSAVEFPAFDPHALLRNGHRMTILGALPRPASASFAALGEPIVVRTDSRTKVRAILHRPAQPTRSALVILHGLGGSSESAYCVGTAHKAVAAGLAALRLNARNCGGTAALTSEPYNGAETADLEAAVRHLVREEGMQRLHLVGFSVGGNQVLRLAAAWGTRPPAAVTGVSTVSPCIDFAAAADLLELGWLNRLIMRRLLRSLKRYIRERAAFDPSVDLTGIDDIVTIREFDERYTAPLSGYAGASDYYARASMRGRMHEIGVPTLVVSAADDPLVPASSLEGLGGVGSPLRLCLTRHGGHVAFVGASRAGAGRGRDPDRRWAENRVVQFALACAACADT